MDKARCYGCNDLGHYKRDCPKFRKEKRKSEEAHVTDISEEPDIKKSKKEESEKSL